MSAFLAYCAARLEQKQKDEAFRIYVTDALYAIAESTARLGGGSSLSMRFADMLKPQDTRTVDEIINDVCAGAGIEVID